MSVKRTLRYHWLRLLRLQDDPRRLAWSMALGIFIGMTPTIPFHFISALTLASLLRISPVPAVLGIQISNPVTIPFLYLTAFRVGHFFLQRGAPLRLPETYNIVDWLALLCRGGLALQVGGVIIAIPPAVVSYFLTRWVITRYRRFKAQKDARVSNLPQNPPAPPGP